MEPLVEIADSLNKAKEVLILSHIIPDGDCLGSALALALALQNDGKKVIVINEDEVPDMYTFLPGSNSIRKIIEFIDLPQLVVVVDSSDPERVGEQLSELFKGKKVINIDHHVSNTKYGDINYVDTNVPATGELVYELLSYMGMPLTASIATNLYTAIVTDSGSFQYESVRPRTLEIAGKLMKEGADLAAVRENLWETRSLVNIRLLAKVLPELQLSEDGLISWVSISKKLQEKLGAKSEHCEGLINYPRSIAGVEIGILFREIEEEVIKVGFRSKSKVDVNLLAAEFGGGGHARAAGCTVKGKMETVINKVIEAAFASLRKG